MRALPALLAVLAVASVRAAPAAEATDRYIAARDSAITAVKGGVGDAEQARLQKELEQQLRGIVGTLRVRGYSGQSGMSPDTLSSGDVGFGQLDGIRFWNADQSASVLVSTEDLLRPWLASHRDWWPDQPNPPAEPAAAFRSEAFYTQAASGDAAVSIFATLPIRPPSGAAAATALLVQQAQDLATEPPTQIAVALMAGGRVFITFADAEAKAQPIAACDAIWRQYKAKAEVLHEKYRASDLKDQASFDEAGRIENAGADALHKCWGEKANGEAGFAAWTKQAQALADAFAAQGRPD